ncbi:helix-turn-helix domain-containing protein [Nubsella zeaxanthinifaciens]|uniref:helix-turn-helix domain-containing protein n=1 Tax=Nubsella zeaxanthinifaciens TaxID=392412 RepID=UPI000DE56305|nr:helix-turn-helix domain-containing protein [Nubsella zeaxanthinifaciens]
MLFQFNLYSCLPLIFFFHIVVYSLLFFIRGFKQEQYADKLMGSFLFIAALLIVPFMVGFAGWYDNQPYRDILFFVPLVHSLAIGPLLYFYVKAIFNRELKITAWQWLHFAPAALYLLVNTVFSLLDLFYFKTYHLTNEHEDPDFATWYTYLSIASILIYLFLSIKHYQQYKRFAAITTSFADQVNLKWLLNFLYAFALLSVMPIINSILSNFTFFERLRYFGPWYYYVAFAVVVYYIAIHAYQLSSLSLNKVMFEPQLLQAIDEEISEQNHKQSNGLADEKLNHIKKELATLMETQLLFERPDLTLTEVAKKLNTNSVVLSKVVNQHFGLNFNDYINQYRVSAVIKRIELPQYKNQTLLAIAFDSGFNSKATFNRAFKKFTNKNPKDFL